MGHVSWAKNYGSQGTISFLPTRVSLHVPHLFETWETLGRVRYTLRAARGCAYTAKLPYSVGLCQFTEVKVLFVIMQVTILPELPIELAKIWKKT